MEKTVNFAVQKAGNFFKRKADIVFCYFPVPSDPLYDAFKTAGKFLSLPLSGSSCATLILFHVFFLQVH